MFQPASSAPTDGRPVLWAYGDGSGGEVMFFRQDHWWGWDEEFDGTDRNCAPYATLDEMAKSDWLWTDLPHALLARSMIKAARQMEAIDRAREEHTGYFRSLIST